MPFDALLANLRHTSADWRKVNKNFINLVVVFHFYFTYIILLNKLRFDQISCSGRSGPR